MRILDTKYFIKLVTFGNDFITFSTPPPELITDKVGICKERATQYRWIEFKGTPIEAYQPIVKGASYPFLHMFTGWIMPVTARLDPWWT